MKITTKIFVYGNNNLRTINCETKNRVENSLEIKIPAGHKKRNLADYRCFPPIPW